MYETSVYFDLFWICFILVWFWFLWVVLAVLELSLYTRLAVNSEICPSLFCEYWN